MPKLYPSNHIVKILVKRGFNFISQKGSHAKFRKIDSVSKSTVIVPMNKKEIPYGTFKSILRQSNLTEEDFNIK